MVERLRYIHGFAAAVSTLVCMSAYAADPSTERTTMPDFCSNREVTCVLPDGPPRLRAASPAPGHTPTGPSTSAQVVITPAQPGTAVGTTSSTAGGTAGTNAPAGTPALEPGTATSRSGSVGAHRATAASGTAATGGGSATGRAR